ncbi:MAG: VOC family protein [Bdellovibrionales bacterium]|nr:VOC family protein [Bdellovibrionales bacterium]
MIDHIAIDVSDLKKSQYFYESALVPLGYKRLMEVPKEFGRRLVFGWGDSAGTDFYIGAGLRNEPRLHIAFRADSREKVEEFYKAALAAGGKDNGKPGLRPEYHEHYYGAFVLDPDGHNVEAVCHDPHKK